MGFPIRGAVIALALCSTVLVGDEAVVGADSGVVTFECVVVNVDTCTVTIPLTANMDEEIGSTMPDTQQWFVTKLSGSGAPYGVTGDGNPQTTWNGVPGGYSGYVWTAILTTGANEPAGAVAEITFGHVTLSSTTTTPETTPPRRSLTWAYPRGATTNARITISSTVSPEPPKGGVVLQREDGTSWVDVDVLVYNQVTKRWSVTIVWRYPKHTSRTFRILAVGSLGYGATYGSPFTISTLSLAG